MKNVILTGSTGGIGSSIASLLEQSGYSVIAIRSRLEDFESLEKEVKSILAEHDVDVLINCAGFGLFKPHEEISTTDIRKMIDVNLTAPLILTGLTLRSLKESRGNIINITSIEATRYSRFSALYTATKTGLRAFSLSLLEEVRKAGVKVTAINPDITNTAFFDNLGFEPLDDPSCSLHPGEIAQAVYTVLQTDGIISEMTIRPRKSGVKKKKRNLSG